MDEPWCSNLLPQGLPVRLLLRPSKQTPSLPRSIPVDVAVCALNDERGLSAAMKNVDTVFHLAGEERKGTRANLMGVDVEGTKTLARVAAAAGIQHFIYLSHLGASPSSAFAVFKAKALGEIAIQQSGVPYTILRSAVIFGPQDQFTVSIKKLLRSAPGLFLMPGEGTNLLQPLWIGDLVTCLTWVIQDSQMKNQVISIGGAEYLAFQEILEIIMGVTRKKRLLIPTSPAFLRLLTLNMEQINLRFPISIFWLDYLAADRTCSIDTLPRQFGLLPARFHNHLDYLKN